LEIKGAFNVSLVIPRECATGDLNFAGVELFVAVLALALANHRLG
jgi:hypothetical protein